MQANPRPGTRVNKQTGKIEEDTWLGYTGERINQKTGEFEEDADWATKVKGIRVHSESGKIQTESWLGWEDAGKRGSVFFLCRKSKENPLFAKYPPQPVRRCPGYEREVEAEK